MLKTLGRVDAAAWVAAVISVAAMIVSIASCNETGRQLALNRSVALNMDCLEVSNKAVNGADWLTFDLNEMSVDAAFGDVGDYHDIHGAGDAIECTLRNYGLAPVNDVILTFDGVVWRLDQTAGPTINVRVASKPLSFAANGSSQAVIALTQVTCFAIRVIAPKTASAVVPPDTTPTTVPVNASQLAELGELFLSPGRSSSFDPPKRSCARFLPRYKRRP